MFVAGYTRSDTKHNEGIFNKVVVTLWWCEVMYFIIMVGDDDNE